MENLKYFLVQAETALRHFGCEKEKMKFMDPNSVEVTTTTNKNNTTSTSLSEFEFQELSVPLLPTWDTETTAN